MAKHPLDLSKFKKVASDSKTTTMQHPHGHKITIVHAVLSPKMKEQIEKLPVHKAEGGDVGGNPKMGKDPRQHQKDAQDLGRGATQDATPPEGAWENLKSGLGFGKKQDKKNYADGGEVNKDQAPVVVNVNGQQPPQMPQELMNQQPQQNMIDYSQAKEDISAPYGTGEAVAHQIADKASQQSPQQMPQMQQQPPQVPPPNQMPQQTASGQPPMMDEYAKNMMGGYQQQVKAAQEKQAADTQLGEQAAKVYQQQIQQDQKNIDISQAANAAANEERQHFISDIQQGYIKPNNYLESRDTGTKVMQAIGLILGGAGAGVTGGPNPAEQFLHAQIDRDIKAQERNLGAKENLLSNNLEHFKNENVARQMLRVQFNDMYTHMIDQAKAQNMGPQAQAAADQLKGQLQQQNAMIMGQIGAGSKGSPDDMLQMMRITNPERAKEMESRYVPGIGFAQIPLTGEARGTIIAKQQLAQMAQDLYQWSAKNSGSLSPSTIAEGKTKAAELQSLYRNAINGGVFKKGEQEFIDQIVDSDPTKFFNSIRTLPKLKEVINSNNHQMGILLRSYGFAGQQPQGFVSRSFKPVQR